MEILKSTKGQTMVLTIKGKIDSNTSPELEKELTSVIESGQKDIEINTEIKRERIARGASAPVK